MEHFHCNPTDYTFRCNGNSSVIVNTNSSVLTNGETTPPILAEPVCLPEGPLITRDEWEGTELSIRCPDGCIVIEKVLFACSMTDGFSEEQREIVERECSDVNEKGKDECIIKATNEFFGTFLDCEKHAARLWIKFR